MEYITNRPMSIISLWPNQIHEGIAGVSQVPYDTENMHSRTISFLLSSHSYLFQFLVFSLLSVFPFIVAFLLRFLPLFFLSFFSVSLFVVLRNFLFITFVLQGMTRWRCTTSRVLVEPAAFEILTVSLIRRLPRSDVFAAMYNTGVKGASNRSSRRRNHFAIALHAALNVCVHASWRMHVCVCEKVDCHVYYMTRHN
jgi:hypothetical protein